MDRNISESLSDLEEEDENANEDTINKIMSKSPKSRCMKLFDNK